MDMAFAQRQLRNCADSVRALTARRGFRILRRVLAVAMLGVVALNSQSLFSQLGAVRHPDAGWLGLAITAETVSLFVYVLMARQLLGLGGVTAPVGGLVRPTLAGIAMGASLPGGVGASNVYWYKTLRRYGADRGLATLVLTGTSVAGAVSLLGLLAIGVAIAGNTGPLAHVHYWLLCTGALAIVLGLAFARRFGPVLTGALRRIAPTLERRPDVRARRLRTILFFAYANWLLDCAALFASLHATHAVPPARSVLLVYVLAQLVANVALLPGGGGTVELSLATGFAAFGQHSGSVLAGGLLYRCLGCWGLIPIGWLGFVLDPATGVMSRWLTAAARTRRAAHPRTAATAEPSAG